MERTKIVKYFVSENISVERFNFGWFCLIHHVVLSFQISKLQILIHNIENSPPTVRATWKHIWYLWPTDCGKHFACIMKTSIIYKMVQFFIMKYKLVIHFDVKRCWLRHKTHACTHQIRVEFRIFGRCHGMMHTYSICSWWISVNCWTTTKSKFIPTQTHTHTSAEHLHKQREFNRKGRKSGNLSNLPFHGWYLDRNAKWKRTGTAGKHGIGMSWKTNTKQL